MQHDEERQLPIYYRELFPGKPDDYIEAVVNEIANRVRKPVVDWTNYRTDFPVGTPDDIIKRTVEKIARAARRVDYRDFKDLFAGSESDEHIESVVKEVTDRVDSYDDYRARWIEVPWQEAQMNLRSFRQLSVGCMIRRPWWYTPDPISRRDSQ